ncbi:MAG TPA: helix-turn-helix domain-containing protein [Clostridia bacterium]|nr:helix-turn-helix domain-containing protein [Clostridia bacterium]
MNGRLLKLDQVAELLGCHVETLRLRIRSGRLKAVRGPHGAYFISARSLRVLRVQKRPFRQRRTPTAEDLDVAWRAVERRLRRAPAAHEEVVPFLEALKISRAIDLRAYRLVCACGLHELGFKVDDIAAELGVCARHARRLIGKDPGVAVSKAAHLWAPVEARRIVRALRGQLQTEGIRFHKWVMRGRRRIGPPTCQAPQKLDQFL